MDTRSRGGLARKIHAVVDGNGLPIQIASQAGKRTIIDLRPSSRHSRTPEQCAWPTVDMMPTGSEHSRVSMALGRTSRHDEIAMTRSASVHIYTAHATWSSGSSPRSSSAGARRRATTSSRRTTSPSSSLPWYAYSCALIESTPSSPPTVSWSGGLSAGTTRRMQSLGRFPTHSNPSINAEILLWGGDDCIRHWPRAGAQLESNFNNVRVRSFILINAPISDEMATLLLMSSNFVRTGAPAHWSARFRGRPSAAPPG